MSDEHDDGSSEDEESSSVPVESPPDERAPNTFFNGLIGGVIGVVLSFIPLSTVIGGAVAGYLEGGDYVAGAKVGAIAGLVALIPFLFLIGIVLIWIPLATGPAGVGIAVWAAVMFALFFGLVYVIGLSIVGGILGAYVKREL